MTKQQFIIHAVNVHQGGGAVLLKAMLSALENYQSTLLQVDSRMDFSESFPKNIRLYRIKPSILQRLLAEWRLHKLTRKNDIVLCFGNLPPLFSNQGRVHLFLQNRYLIDDVSLTGFSLKVKLRLLIERLWLTWRRHVVDEFIVQTVSMQKTLKKRFKEISSIRIQPFIDEIQSFQNNVVFLDKQQMLYDFIYPATGDPHKNHIRLVEAWCLLAEEDIYPSLCVTLNIEQNLALCSWLEKKIKRHNLKIHNIGFIHSKQMTELYKSVKAIIYPSFLESFGLPLIEAKILGLPILASELDFVRDLFDPEQTFDPHSSRSIARAVKRFLRIEEQKAQPIGAKAFLRNLNLII